MNLLIWIGEWVIWRTYDTAAEAESGMAYWKKKTDLPLRLEGVTDAKQPKAAGDPLGTIIRPPEQTPPSPVIPTQESTLSMSETRNDAMWWIVGGAALLAIGAVSLAGILLSQNTVKDSWRPDDLFLE